jgi:hypothetical protein
MEECAICELILNSMVWQLIFELTRVENQAKTQDPVDARAAVKAFTEQHSLPYKFGESAVQCGESLLSGSSHRWLVSETHRPSSAAPSTFSCMARLSNFLVRSPKLHVSRYHFGGLPRKIPSQLVLVSESSERSLNRPHILTLDRRDRGLS